MLLALRARPSKLDQVKYFCTLVLIPVLVVLTLRLPVPDAGSARVESFLFRKRLSFALKTTRIEGYVFNDAPWHSEVSASAVHLLRVIGAQSIHIFEQSGVTSDFSWNIHGARDVDVDIDSKSAIENFYRSCTQSPPAVTILLLVTPEEMSSSTWRAVPQLSNCRGCCRVLWMCHNIHRCRPSDNVILLPHALTVLAPTERMTTVWQRRGYEAVTWIPQLPRLSDEVPNRFGLRSRAHLGLLVPGSINMSKRNYASLVKLHGPADHDIVVTFFGKCLGFVECALIRSIVAQLRDQGIHAIHSSNFTLGRKLSFAHLRDVISTNDFIFPAIDETVPFASAYTREGKLSASIVLAVSSARPLILWCPLAAEYGLVKQICYSSSQFAKLAIQSAHEMSAFEYEAAAIELMALRSAMSVKTVSALTQIFRNCHSAGVKAY
jgi:hypothetical protein